MRTFWLSLLALAAMAGLPAPSHAAWLGVRNASGVPIIVQTGVVVNNNVVPGRPTVLYPGDVAWDCAVKPCIKCVVIADQKNPKQVLLQANFPCGPGDVFLSVKMMGPGQYHLVPTMPPVNPRRR